MNPSFAPPNGTTRPRVAVIPRLLAMLSFSMAALGASLSGFLLYRVLEAMRMAENAGIGAITGGLAEANIPVLVGLYAAIAGGFITIIVAAVRTGVSTTTTSPASWFYIITFALCSLPVGLLWWTESIFIQALYPGSEGIAYVGATIRSLVILLMIAGPLSALLSFILSVWPFKSAAQGHWLAIAVLVFIQIILILVTVFFQMRTSWLWRVMEAESF